MPDVDAQGGASAVRQAATGRTIEDIQDRLLEMQQELDARLPVDPAQTDEPPEPG